MGQRNYVFTKGESMSSLADGLCTLSLRVKKMVTQFRLSGKNLNSLKLYLCCNEPESLPEPKALPGLHLVKIVIVRNEIPLSLKCKQLIDLWLMEI